RRVRATWTVLRDVCPAARAARPRRRVPALLRRLGRWPRPLRQPGFLFRLRAHPQPAAGGGRSGRIRRGVGGRHAAAARRSGADRRVQPLGPNSRTRMSAAVRLGLRANAGQFALLVALNALVGAMVGLERSVLPLVGKQDFGLRSTSAVLAFVVAFGAAKAVTNLAAGALAERVSRKRLLVAGW